MDGCPRFSARIGLTGMEERVTYEMGRICECTRLSERLAGLF